MHCPSLVLLIQVKAVRFTVVGRPAPVSREKFFWHLWAHIQELVAAGLGGQPFVLSIWQIPCPLPTFYHCEEPDEQVAGHQPISQRRHFLPFILSRNSSVEERGVILIKEICWVSNKAGSDILYQSGSFSKAPGSFCFFLRAAHELITRAWGISHVHKGSRMFININEPVPATSEEPWAICTCPVCHAVFSDVLLLKQRKPCLKSLDFPFVESTQAGINLVPLVCSEGCGCYP